MDNPFEIYPWKLRDIKDQIRENKTKVTLIFFQKKKIIDLIENEINKTHTQSHTQDATAAVSKENM